MFKKAFSVFSVILVLGLVFWGCGPEDKGKEKKIMATVFLKIAANVFADPIFDRPEKPDVFIFHVIKIGRKWFILTHDVLK